MKENSLLYWIWLILVYVNVIYNFCVSTCGESDGIWVYQYKNNYKLQFTGLIINNRFFRLKKIRSSKLELCFGVKYKVWFEIHADQIDKFIRLYKKIKKSKSAEEVYALVKAGFIKGKSAIEVLEAVVNGKCTITKTELWDNILWNQSKEEKCSIVIGDKKLWAVFWDNNTDQDKPPSQTV